MSTRRRAAFDPDALDADLDSILPSSTGSSGAETVIPTLPSRKPKLVTAPSAVDGAPPARAEKRERPNPKQIAEPQGGASPTGARMSPPEVAVAAEVYAALRDLTLSERRSDPVGARTYGQVALDAVEQHADELQRHWINRPVPRSGGLFTRVSDSSGPAKRRRHAAAPARVPLAGVIASDTDLLDDLAAQWGAGSRSALVEAALRLYLKVP